MIEIKTTSKVIPKIYAYSHPTYPDHIGYLKIGVTERSVEQRVKEDHLTNNVKYQIEYETAGLRNDNYTFSDTDLHAFLQNKGIHRLKNINGRYTEWFKITKEQLMAYIEEFKDGRFEIKSDSSLITYTLRAEQAEAVELTAKYYEENPEGKFLWNAKPRFGKTLTAYDFCKKIDARKVLIVTNRPAISDSWFSDYCKFIKPNSDYLFLGSMRIENGNERSLLRREVQENAILQTKPFFFFISMQDIKGQDKETYDAITFKEKNQWIFDKERNSWDVIIIDESHEGVKTEKADYVLRNLHYDFELHLSGTPFKAIASNEFSSEQIYNWTYADEQDVKTNWDYSKGENPYIKLPRLNIFTYTLSNTLEIVTEQALNEGNEYAFDLVEFFKIKDNKFLYESEIIRFLDNLSGLNPHFTNIKKPYPFASDEIRNELKHTFWLLPNVKSSELMKELLTNHVIFKDYQVVLAAGKGDNEGIGRTSLEKVKQAISSCDRSITLSCGQLTTGITIPEWTAVLMLNNTSSPTTYLQTTFRAQNPYTYTDSATLETRYKTNCYLFDFAPDRVLKILADYADNIINTHHQRIDKVKTLLNFLNVLAEDDEGRLKQLDANEVLELPLKLITKEVVTRGFMSNRLFANIARIFGAPAEIREILSKLQPEKNKRVEIATPLTIVSQVNEDGSPYVTANDIQKVINTSNGLLGKKKYVIEGSSEAIAIEELIAKGDLNQTQKEQLPTIVTAEQYQELAKQEVAKAKEKDQNSEENKVKDRLRGFSRTIPMFLMAYGDVDNVPTLKSFDLKVEDKEFKAMTSITKEEFHKLRDGFEYVEKGITKRFEGLFDEQVFNASIKEFIDVKRRLANYFEQTTEDIFDYIPPQQTNQIFTPKATVIQMVNLLVENDPLIFQDRNKTYIDLYMKSGLYIVEIVKRLFDGLAKEIPDKKTRIIHIVTKQVFGLAPTNILYNITTNYILGFLKRDGFSDDDINQLNSNFKQFDLVNVIKDKKDMAKIFSTIYQRGEDMKFDVVIGNPPYQVADGGAQASAMNVFQEFVMLGNNIASEYNCMVFPAKWRTGGKGLDKFREEMINNTQVKIIHDYALSSLVFSNVDIKGGVCIALFDQKHNGKCQITLHNADGSHSMSFRYLNEGNVGVFIRYPELLSILKKVNSLGEEKFSKIVSVLRPYGLRTDFFKNPNKYGYGPLFDDRRHADDITIYGLIGLKRVIKYAPKDYLKVDVARALKKYKVFVPESNGSGAIGEVLSTPIIGTPIIGTPMESCTETFISVGNFETEQNAINCNNYIQSKFLRCLLGILKVTQHNSKKTWDCIPMQDFTDSSDIDWNRSVRDVDLKLYKKYGLSEEEINFIETNIKEME